MTDMRFTCPHCQQSLEAPLDMAGITIGCPNCSKAVKIPTPNTPLTSPVRPPADQSASKATQGAPVSNDRTHPHEKRKTTDISRKPLVAGAIAIVLAAITFGVWMLRNTTSTFFETKTDEFCGTWKMARTDNSMYIHKELPLFTQPITIKRLAGALKQRDSSLTRGLYLVYTREASPNYPPSIRRHEAVKHEDGLHWDHGFEGGASAVFIKDGQDLKLTWIPGDSLPSCSAWFRQAGVSSNAVEGKEQAGCSEIQRKYEGLLETVELNDLMNEQRKAKAVAADLKIKPDDLRNEAIVDHAMKTAQKRNRKPSDVLIKMLPETYWRLAELELNYGGKLFLPGSDPNLYIQQWACCRTLEILFEFAPEYREKTAVLLANYIRKQLAECRSQAKTLDAIAASAREPLLRLDIDGFMKGVANERTTGFLPLGQAQRAFGFFAQLRIKPDERLTSEMQKVKPQYIDRLWGNTPYDSTASARVQFNAAEITLARQLMPVVAEAIRSNSSEKLWQTNGLSDLRRPIHGLRGMVEAAWFDSQLSQADKDSYSTFVRTYSQWECSNGAPLENNIGWLNSPPTPLWEMLIAAAMRHPEELLPILIEQLPGNCNLAVALLDHTRSDKFRKFDENSAKRIASAAEAALIATIKAHAVEVGGADKNSPKKMELFFAFCQKRWPHSSPKTVFRQLFGTQTSVLLDNDDFYFALAWYQQQQKAPFNRLSYVGMGTPDLNRIDLTAYLAKFPNGKNSALAKAWLTAN